MLLFNYLQTLLPELTPSEAKVHLAKFNGQDDPLDVYVSGTFDEWQEWQSQKNFKRRFVVSLIRAGHLQRWLYAGMFTVEGYEPLKVRSGWDKAFYRYRLSRIAVTDEYAGRMYVHSNYKSRAAYLKGETLVDDLRIQEISPVKLTFGEFPGYRQLTLTRDQLRLIIFNNLPTWRTALSTVKGIYLLTDTLTQQLYIGQANSLGGFWNRWCDYFKTGHGGNKGLIEELGTADEERLRGINFSILEVMDPNATESEINQRESHWKKILLSRVVGYNRN